MIGLLILHPVQRALKIALENNHRFTLSSTRPGTVQLSLIRRRAGPLSRSPCSLFNWQRRRAALAEESHVFRSATARLLSQKHFRVQFRKVACHRYGNPVVAAEVTHFAFDAAPTQQRANGRTDSGTLHPATQGNLRNVAVENASPFFPKLRGTPIDFVEIST